MGRAQALKLSEVRGVFRLVGELRAMGRDADAWPRHMAEQLLRLVGAKAAFTGEGYPQGEALVYNGFAAAGLTDAADARGMGRFAAAPEVAASRFMRPFADHHRRRFLAARDELFPDADWYGSDYFHDYRAPCGLDGWLHSQFFLAGTGGTHMICLSRPPGDRRFTPRDARLLGLFHDELRRVWVERPPATVAAGGVSAEVAALPPRLRATLDRLRAGDAEKQAADHLGVTRHAVHANVKRLHRWFGVSSRGELLAKVGQTDDDFRPRLHGPPPGWHPPRAAAPRDRRLVEVG